MLLETLVKQVSLVEKSIAELNFAMRHASPYSVDALRKQKEELEEVLFELMESCITSNFDLEYMLGKNGECLRDCFRPVYTGKPVVLPKPKWDTPPPPPPPDPPEPPLPTVDGVNLILYIDTSGSMKGTLSAGGKLRKELVSFASYLKHEATRGNIPCTVSLIWYGDKTDLGGDGSSYYTIAMNKETVANFETKLSRPTWYRGGVGLPESGLLAIKETIASVVKDGVQNTLIYITDAPSKKMEANVSPTVVKNLFATHNLKKYAIHPTAKEPIINHIFDGVREYTATPYNIIEWAEKTLRP